MPDVIDPGTRLDPGARVFAKPREGLKVPKPGHAPGRPDANDYLAADGELVTVNRYWRRAAMRGDVQLLSGKQAEKAASAAKPKPEAAMSADGDKATKGK